MEQTAISDNPWLVIYKPNQRATLRLFCFHYGGGSASAFRSWANFLPTSIELVAIQLPGREGRFNEAFVTEFKNLIDMLADVIGPYLDKPYVVFGHSLGTIKSFEWIREIKKRGLEQPLLYIPSGMPAPQFSGLEPPISSLPEKEFVNELLKEYGDTLETVLENNELRSVFIPQLRADFKLLEDYQYHKGIRFDCPIVAFAGTNETKIGEKELEGWAEHTNSTFRTNRFPGDHFFIHSAESRVLQTISHELAGIMQSF